MSAESSRAKFFRQSGWMVMATFAGGVCMFAVHVFAPYLGDTEYGLFGTLLAMMNVMLIPALGLQTVLAQQTAAALHGEDQARLTGTVRGVLGWTFLIWLAIAATVLVFQNHFLRVLTITNPLALWLVLLVGLGLLWQPILLGVLQGQQNFLWLGWAQIVNGAGRFISVAVIVVLLGGKATGAVGGALLGITGALLIGFVQSRRVWAAKARRPFDWKPWLANVVPLTLGLGASQFIFSVDMIIVRGLYGEQQTGFYSASGMIGRGLVMFTAPLTAVMFPKIVQNVAQGKKSNLLVLTLVATAVLGTIGAAGCTLVAAVLRSVVQAPDAITGLLPAAVLAKLLKHPDAVLTIGRLLPWFVWCMLPLALANVLLNNLLARMDFRAVPALVMTVAVYATAAISFGSSFLRVIQILGLFNLLFLAVLALYTWIAAKWPRNLPAAPALTIPV